LASEGERKGAPSQQLSVVIVRFLTAPVPEGPVAQFLLFIEIEIEAREFLIGVFLPLKMSL
jgi:hypothetical protein